MSTLEKQQTPGFLFLMDQILKMERNSKTTRVDIIKEIASHKHVTICEKTIERQFRLNDFLLKEKWSFDDQRDLHPPSTKTLNQLTRYYGDTEHITFEDYIDDNSEMIREEGFYEKASVKALDVIFGCNDTTEEILQKILQLLRKVKSQELQIELILRVLKTVRGGKESDKKDVNNEELLNGLIAVNLKLVTYLKLISGLTIALAVSDINAVQDFFVDIQDGVMENFNGFDKNKDYIDEEVNLNDEKKRFIRLAS